MRNLRGFSLLEVIAVTAIVAVTGAVALPALFEGEDIRCRREAARLAAALGTAAEEALLTGRVHAAVLAPDGYRFERREVGGAWQPAESPALAAHRMAEGIRIELAQADGAVLPPGERLAFSPSADHPPFEVRLAHPRGQVRVVGAGLGEPYVETP